MPDAPHQPSFELAHVSDEAGDGWLIIRTGPKRHVVRRVKDRTTADVVRNAMEALEEQSPGQPDAE